MVTVKLPDEWKAKFPFICCTVPKEPWWQTLDCFWTKLLTKQGRGFSPQGTVMDKLKHKKIPLKTIGLHFLDMWDIFQGLAVLTSQKLQNQVTKEKPVRGHCILLPPQLASMAVHLPLLATDCRAAGNPSPPLLHLPGFSLLLTMVPFRCKSRQDSGGREGHTERCKQCSWN